MATPQVDSTWRRVGAIVRVVDCSPLTVICAWCGLLVQEGNEVVSHGICLPCAMDFLARLPADYLRTVADADGTVSLFSGYRLAIDQIHSPHGAA